MPPRPPKEQVSPAAAVVPKATGTIWYMGAKTRVLDRLGAVIGPLLETASDRLRQQGVWRPPVLLDLFTGTGAVATHLAPHAQVIAADVQRYATVLAEAALTGRAAGAIHPSARAMIQERAAFARVLLTEAFAERVARDAALRAAARDDAGLCAYREFAEASPLTDPEGFLAQRPEGEPVCLITAYYGGVYFSFEQAIEIDALRFALSAITDPTERTLGLASLLFCASKATSATAHFAQPRPLGRLSEVKNLIRRRRIPITPFFWARREALAQSEVRPIAPVRAVTGSYPEVFEALNDAPIDVVYADPPYTQDNYSRFYHVLEVIASSGAPPLQRRNGELTKGRYPDRAFRHRSGFTQRLQVEAEFDRVSRLAAERGAALVWSYATSNGLLVQHVYKGELSRLQALLEVHYENVVIETFGLHHSGAGDKNHQATELIAVCTGPRPQTRGSGCAAAPRARVAPEGSGSCAT
ncbi:MAG: DNA adenine methylase [Planctomycetota bacterium]